MNNYLLARLMVVYLVCVLSGLCKILGGFSDKVIKHALQTGHVSCLLRYHFAKHRE